MRDNLELILHMKTSFYYRQHLAGEMLSPYYCEIMPIAGLPVMNAESVCTQHECVYINSFIDTCKRTLIHIYVFSFQCRPALFFINSLR